MSETAQWIIIIAGIVILIALLLHRKIKNKGKNGSGSCSCCSDTSCTLRNIRPPENISSADNRPSPTQQRYPSPTKNAHTIEKIIKFH